ncbi:MAG: hypothetical protein ACOY3P_03565 [Planctomycetota bacterium]
MDTTIFIAQPTYAGARVDSVIAAASMATARYRFRYVSLGKSLLACNFNTLWTTALSDYEAGNCTHFAMLHPDITPDGFWVDLLMDQLERHRLDMISAVVPLKDARGLTSTAVDRDQTGFHIRRLSLTEVYRLPEVFCKEDTIEHGLNPAGLPLLVNTGCWLADLRNPRWFQCDALGRLVCSFTINDCVMRRPDDGRWFPKVESEDWWFSRRMHEVGLRYAATRAVPLTHHGLGEYHNRGPWGSVEHEEDYLIQLPHGPASTESPASTETLVATEALA